MAKRKTAEEKAAEIKKEIQEEAKPVCDHALLREQIGGGYIVCPVCKQQIP